MSSLNIKQGSEAHFPEYPLASPSNNEIDLLNLIEVLWRAKKTVMAVVYKGAVPDNFKPGTELYAEGSYVAAAGVFQAGGLTTTCPSKYKKENRR